MFPRADTPGQSFQTTTNQEGKLTESGFIAWLFVLAAQDKVELAEFYREKARLMGAAVWAAGWDGARFRRAYDAFGKPVGSSLNDEWQIFRETQGMCVMAGLGL